MQSSDDLISFRYSVDCVSLFMISCFLFICRRFCRSLKFMMSSSFRRRYSFCSMNSCSYSLLNYSRMSSASLIRYIISSFFWICSLKSSVFFLTVFSSFFFRSALTTSNMSRASSQAHSSFLRFSFCCLSQSSRKSCSSFAFLCQISTILFATQSLQSLASLDFLERLKV